MAASKWRMNGLWRMAGVLLLCALLLSNEVMSQDDASTDATDAPAADPPADAAAVTDAPDAAAAPDATAAPDAGSAPTVAAAGDSAPSAAPGDNPFPATILNVAFDPDTSGTSGTTAGPVVANDPVVVVQEQPTSVKVVPDVKCVGQDEISESNAVKVEVETDDCEATKRIIQENPAGWCNTPTCELKIFQNGKTMMVASDNAKLATVTEELQSENLKNKLGVTKVQPPSSSDYSVFVGLLVTGLLAALAITIGYFKCQRKADPKGVRLAEEAYPVDQENQGNTLVSVAPLNPPPETPEKPSVNGESTEAAKTQPAPPTNGHSTAKTADTEL